MKKKRGYLVIAVVAALMIFRIYQRLSTKSLVKEKAEILITVQKVGQTTLNEIVLLSGTVEPRQKAPVISRVSGRLDEVFFREGEPVKKGAVLAKIEERDYKLLLIEARSALKAAAAELENAGGFYKRMSGLFAEEVITAQEMDNARNRLDAARAAVNRLEAQTELAREQLSDCNIIAPFAGFVGSRFFDPGIFLTPVSGPIMELVDLSSVKVSIPLGETELARLRSGQSVQIKPDAFPEIIFSGRVAGINPVLDPVTRTTTCEIVISNPGYLLKSGMFVRAEINLSTRKDVLAVPQEAISRQGEKTFVFVIKDATARQKEVFLDIQDGNLLEVKSGLASGDVIATSGIDILFENAKVEVVKE
ncbi:MAG: efflux RND transporter periplasmic adaptor subunit [Candidatus Omnitrophota bacterium]